MSDSNEPTLIIGSVGAIVTAVIVLLVSFGVPITADQRSAISALAALVIPIVTSIVIRHYVTPASKVVAPVIVDLPAPPIAVAPPPTV